MSETNFQSFNGLENLVEVGGYFLVEENNTLLSSDLIESLISVGGDFKFEECPAGHSSNLKSPPTEIKLSIKSEDRRVLFSSTRK